MINKIKIVYIILAAVLVLPVACKKYETVPLDPLNEDLVFDKMDINGYYAEQALNHVYSIMPNGFNRIDNNFLDAATDDAIPSVNSSTIDIISSGRQSSTQTVDDAWGKNYTGIRKANLFLSKIDVVPVTDQLKVYWKAEARFLRAMFCFELVKRYGGVPLIGDRVLDITDDLNIPKSNYDECVNYIVSECDAISSQLRKEPVADNEIGKITQGAALALKSRMLLYAASQFNNTSNDVKKWQNAMDAAKQVIDLKFYALNANFTALFVNRKNTEVILAFQRGKDQSIEKNNAPIGFTAPNASSGFTSPTQDLVNAFPMLNGKAITDETSGYLQETPYDKRDPRLNATVFYNGSKWLSRSVGTYEGGPDKPNTPPLTQTRTGYYLRKFMADFSTNTAYSNQDHNFIIFRYAEVLLNYAEAANETGQTSIAYDQLKLIRKRAGITAGADQLYGLKPAMTQTEMRDAIRLERRIEMAFEEQRFWDVRRWKIAETEFNKPLHGITITKTGSTFTYALSTAAQIVFAAPRMYLFPIPNSEVLKNTALVQNPGW